MSTTLTLLFVRNLGELDSPFLAALQGASDCLLLENGIENIKFVLSCQPVDAIILAPDRVQDHAVSGLSKVAPRTPLIMLRHPSQRLVTKPAGIAAVCYADPEDDEVVNAMLVFFAVMLGKPVPGFGNRVPSASTDPPSAFYRSLAPDPANRGCSSS